jgi:transcription initiation factor IIE alpha subunit
MKEDRHTYVQCAHCAVQIRLDEAVKYTNVLIYGSHYHCKECDPDGDWNCVSHDLDNDLH